MQPKPKVLLLQGIPLRHANLPVRESARSQRIRPGSEVHDEVIHSNPSSQGHDMHVRPSPRFEHDEFMPDRVWQGPCHQESAVNAAKSQVWATEPGEDMLLSIRTSHNAIGHLRPLRIVVRENKVSPGMQLFAYQQPVDEKTSPHLVDRTGCLPGVPQKSVPCLVRLDGRQPPAGR